MLKLRTWFACAILGSQALQAAPEISVQRWEGEELTSTGGGNVGNLQVNPNALLTEVGPNPNASSPVSYAFKWRLGESDVGAQAGGALAATKLDTFAANGTITVIVTETVTGSPTYLDVAGTPAATKVQSKLGAHFDGTGKISSGLTLSFPDNFSVEAWVRPQTTTGTQALVYCGTAGTNGFGIYQVDGVLRGRLGGAGDVGEASFSAGEWVHVALVRKAGVATFYVNGQAAGASVTTPYAKAIGGGITAGGTPAGTDLFTGDLDEVRWAILGDSFDAAKHLLYFQSGQPLHVTVDHQSNPALTGPVDFGALPTNSSLERVLYVTNQSFATVPALSATILDDPAGDFELRDPLNPIELKPYVTASVRIRYSPKSLGTRSAKVRFSSGIQGETPTDVALVGLGDLQPLRVQVAGQTTAVEPGQVVEMPASAVGKTSSLLLEVSSLSGTVPTLVPLLEGPHPADFAVALVSRRRTATGDKATYRVTFKPGSSGERSAGLRLQSGPPTLTAFTLTVAGWGLVKPNLPSSPATMVLRLGDTTTFHPLPIMASSAVIMPWPGWLVYPPDNTYQWRKNGVPIKGETQSSIGLEATSLNVAGTYSLAATNAAGTTVVDVLQLAVMDPVLQGGELAGVGKPFTITARAAGPEVKYQWFADSLPLDGETKATLTVVSAGPAQVSYHCAVKCGGEVQLSEPLNVKFVAPPVVTGFTEAPVMRAYVLGALEMAVNGEATSYGAANLPPGLGVDEKYGSIYGRPTTIGTYNVKLWASNPGGRSAIVTVPLQVIALPSEVVGTFVGTSPAPSSGDDYSRAFVRLTTTRTASFSGRFIGLNRSWPFAGRFSFYFSEKLVIAYAPLLVAGESKPAELSIIVSDEGAKVFLWPFNNIQMIVEATRCLSDTSDIAGRYNAGIVTDEMQFNVTTPIPGGRGFASLVVGANGLATVSGRLADGVAFTCASGVTSNGVPLFSLPYGDESRVIATLRATGDASTGYFRWSKKARPNDASFPEGWNTLYAQARGSRYRAPSAGERLLGAPVRTPNGVLVFSGGDLSEPATMPLSLSQGAARPAPQPTSPKSFSMMINAATGQFSGTCLLGTPAQSTSFHGLIVPSADEGIGQFVRGPQKISGDLSLR